MNCQRCGTQFQGSFCPNCGAPAGSPPIGGQSVPGAGGNGRAQKPVTKRWWFWVLCGLTLLVLIGTLSSLSKNGKETTKSEQIADVEETRQEETQKEATKQEEPKKEDPQSKKSSLGKASSVGAAEADTTESEGDAPEAPQADGNTEQTTEANVGESVLIDQNGIRITTVSLEYDSWSGPTLHVLVENNSDANVTVQVRESCVNGAMMDASFYCDVAAGKKANGEITFIKSDLETTGIKTIQTMEFWFSVINPETWDTLFDCDPVTVTTSAAGTFFTEIRPNRPRDYGQGRRQSHRPRAGHIRRNMGAAGTLLY